MLWLVSLLIPTVFCQFFSPIVPSNQYYPPSSFYGHLRRSPYPVVHQQDQQQHLIPISPLNNGYIQPNGFGSDYAAYHRNAALLQNSQLNVEEYPQQREGYLQQQGYPQPFPPRMVQTELPTQVIYGKPVEESESALVNGHVAAHSSLSLPKFLEGVDQDIIDEYKTIIRRPNSKYEDQIKELDQLVSKLDDQRQFMQENDEIEESHRKKVHDFVGQMSDTAQQQFAKISALLRNPALANEERWARVMALYGKMDPNLKTEFESKFKEFS